MTDFNLTNEYCIYNGLDQEEAAIQHILNIASEFYRINDISINNDKTVVISINCRVSNLYLTISGLPISVAKKGESYCYLGIFLSSEDLSKPNLAKTKLDVWFFVNLVLKKVILDKQFAYLVSAILFLIVSYCTQFNFIPAESKSASVVSFANSIGILDQLFSHKFYDLQKWMDPRGPISVWFEIFACFLDGLVFSFDDSLLLDGLTSFDIRQSHVFSVIGENLLQASTAHFSVYTDGSLSGLNISGMKADTAVYFEDVDLDIGMRVSGLVSSTMAEL
ncbi:hypothetical protein G9A89_017311 [Geosiphon pyriformis]|nr:hypothetical protein G9A89_017311 [Geosiphon pyriformis]